MDRCKRTSTLLVLPAALAVTSCYRAAHPVRTRAASDFACPAHLVAIEAQDGRRFRAEGCGQIAQYVCIRNAPAYVPRMGSYVTEVECIRDGEVQSSTPPSPPKRPEMPRSAPPTGAVGFTLGNPLREAESICTASGHAWTARESGGSCSGAPLSAGFHATVDLRSCDNLLCRIDVIDRPQGLDSDGWIDRFASLKRKIEARYGDQHETKQELSAGCAANILPCLNAGQAAIWLIWRWPASHTLTLSMGKLGDSSAIRISYELIRKPASAL